MPSSFPASGIREVVIGTITPGNEPADAVTSGDHLLWIEHRGDYRIVFLDGKQQAAEYAKIFDLHFSRDGAHSGFVAELSGQQFFVSDGEVRSRYPRISGVYFDPKADSYVLGGCTREHCHLVWDGKEVGPAYDDIQSPLFTSDKSHYFFLGQRDNQWFLVRDGQEQGPPMDECNHLSISPDGRHTSIAALRKGNWTWIVDGAPGPAFPVIGYLSVAPDWKRYAYAGVRSFITGRFLPRSTEKGSVIVDGNVVASYEGLGFGNEVRLPGLAPALYVGPDGVSDPLFLEDGRLLYAARRGKSDFVMLLDGVAGPAFEFLFSSVAVAGHGKHFAYLGFRGGNLLEVIDQQPGRSLPQLQRGEAAGGVVLTDDAAHLGYVLSVRGYYLETGTPRRGMRHAVVDGQPGLSYDALEILNFQFSSDGRHHAYLVSGARGDRDLVVFDGLESPLYDSVVQGSLRFLDPRTISFVALKGHTYVRVTEALQ